VKDWDAGFADEIGGFLADDPTPRSTRSRRKLRAGKSACCAPDFTAAGGDLFALLAIPWTDQETAEFLRLVGIEDAQGN